MKQFRNLAYVLASVLLLAGIAAVLIVYGPAQVINGKRPRVRADIENLEKAVTAFRMEYDRYPESLDELMNPLQTAAGIEEPIMPRLPIDPWGTAYFYSLENSGPLIRSAGRDRVLGTKDDASNRDEYEHAR